MWVATEKLPRSPGHPFYERLNQVLAKAGDPCLRIQPGIADASPDGGRHASESPKPRLDAPFYGYLGPNGALDSQESPLGALLGVDPARFAVLGSWNPSLGHLNANVRKEHKPEKSGFCHGLLGDSANLQATTRVNTAQASKRASTAAGGATMDALDRPTNELVAVLRMAFEE